MGWWGYYSYIKSVSDKKQIIARIMNYPMKDIITQCQKDFGYTDDDMAILEIELKRYFSLLAVMEKPGGIGMYSLDVDKLWHSFILFTKRYAHFCNTYVGHFIHHTPKINAVKSPEQLAKAQKDYHAFVKNYEEIFKIEVHPIWFLDWCEN